MVAARIIVGARNVAALPQLSPTSVQILPPPSRITERIAGHMVDITACFNSSGRLQQGQWMVGACSEEAARRGGYPQDLTRVKCSQGLTRGCYPLGLGEMHCPLGLKRGYCPQTLTKGQRP